MFFAFFQIVLIAWLLSGELIWCVALMAFTSCSMLFCSTFFKKNDTSLWLPNLIKYTVYVVFIVFIVGWKNPCFEVEVGERFRVLKNIENCFFLPTCIDTDFCRKNSFFDAVQILTSLVFVYSVVRLCNCNRRFLVYLLPFFSTNAVLMACFAIWQKNVGLQMMYGCFYSVGDFYGTFFLSNAAGAFFNMSIAASAASFKMLFDSSKKGSFIPFVFLCYIPIFVYASFDCGSTMAKICCICTLIGLPFPYLVMKLARRHFKRFSILFIVFILSFGGTFLFFNDNIIGALQKIDPFAEQSMSTRIEMYKTSSELIRERPLFGYGGGACKDILSSAMIKKQKSEKAFFRGTDHAHSDVLEYTLDYGLLGMAFLVLLFLFWGRDFFGVSGNVENGFLAWGALVCLCHSCMDMELHIPSTMLTFGLLVALSICRGNLQSERNFL